MCGTLVACGGSGTGSGTANYASQLASLQTLDTTLFTPEANLPTGSATYRGAASFNVDNGSPTTLTGYYGELAVNVRFADDTLFGSVTNMANFDQDPVSGSISITNGVLTGNNTGIGDGLTADASGTIDGNSLTMDVTGHFFDSTGGGIALYFDETTSLGGGVGLGVR